MQDKASPSTEFNFASSQPSRLANFLRNHLQLWTGSELSNKGNPSFHLSSWARWVPSRLSGPPLNPNSIDQ